MPLATFQKGLQTPSPIDEFLSGNTKALTKEQIKGGLLFDSHLCSTCHTGKDFGGQMKQKVGMRTPWPNQRDQGSFYINNDPKFKMVFRVSPLRNVAKTAPYFHDSSSKKLSDAILKMAKYELGQYISQKEADSIATFLTALTGKVPKEYIKKPVIPKE